MGKPNNGRRKTPNNPDPMTNPRTMGREGLKIIRNIAFGKYNIYNDGHVFRNRDFVNATIAEVDKLIVKHGVHVAAIQYAYAGTQDPAVLRILHEDTKAYEGYVIARDALQSILTTGDTGFLHVLASKLPNYKYNI